MREQERGRGNGAGIYSLRLLMGLRSERNKMFLIELSPTLNMLKIMSYSTALHKLHVWSFLEVQYSTGLLEWLFIKCVSFMW